MGSYQDQIDDLIDTSKAQGWRYDRANSNHHRFYAPDGKTIVTFASTPSDHRGWLNSLAEMKRAGYVPPNQDYRPATLGDVLSSATQAEVSEQSRPKARHGEVQAAVLDFAQTRKGLFYSDDLKRYVRGRVPSTTDDSIQQTINRLVNVEQREGTLVRMERGVFKWVPNAEPQPEVTPVVAIVTPRPPPPPTTTDAVDDDIAELDAALAALGKIESVVRRNREVMRQFKELQQALSKLGIRA